MLSGAGIGLVAGLISSMLVVFKVRPQQSRMNKFAAGFAVGSMLIVLSVFVLDYFDYW